MGAGSAEVNRSSQPEQLPHASCSACELLSMRAGTRLPGWKFLSTLFAATTERLTVSFRTQLSLITHCHSANGINGLHFIRICNKQTTSQRPHASTVKLHFLTTDGHIIQLHNAADIRQSQIPKRPACTASRGHRTLRLGRNCTPEPCSICCYGTYANGVPANN